MTKKWSFSLNGATIVIAADTGKYIDYRAMSKNCDACNFWKQKRRQLQNDMKAL